MNPYGGGPPQQPPGGGYGQPPGGYGPPPGGGGYGAPPGGGGYGAPPGQPFGAGPQQFGGGGQMMQAAPPPKKKGMSGCLIAFLVVLGLFIVGGGIVGYLVWREVGGLASGVAEIAGIMADAAKAPGTKEMKDDAGCDEAFALDVDKLTKAINKLEAEIAKKENRDPKPMEDFTEDGTAFLATCVVKGSKAPKCDDVAKAYVDGAKPKDKFLVSVTKNDQNGETVCAGIYDDDGKKVSDSKGFKMPKTPN